jgi:hypothetical protein
MAKHDPLLDIYRPAWGIKESQIDELNRQLNNSGRYSKNKVRRFFRPVGKSRDNIIKQSELRATHSVFDQNDEQGSVYGLAEYVRIGLSAVRPSKLWVPTLPVYHPGPEVGKSDKAIFVGHSEDVIDDRTIGKLLIQKYYADQELPLDIWHEDGAATAILLARARSNEMLDMVGFTEGLLVKSPELLPARLALGGINRVQRG